MSSSSFTSLHITASDVILKLNSLFTLMVFVGLSSWKSKDPRKNPNPYRACAPTTTTVADNVVAFHVYSFTCLLFSSLVALVLKLVIRLSRITSSRYPAAIEFLARINRTTLPVGMLVSVVGSVSGFGFFMLASFNIDQIVLVTLACASPDSVTAVIPLLSLVAIALLICAYVVVYALPLAGFRVFKNDNDVKSGGNDVEQECSVGCI